MNRLQCIVCKTPLACSCDCKQITEMCKICHACMRKGPKPAATHRCLKCKKVYIIDYGHNCPYSEENLEQAGQDQTPYLSD